jgi:hypothetical protein
MTIQEFSNEFDIMYNNIMSNQAPGLTEYEKSVFLTEAQNAIVLETYSGRNNKGTSFESNEESRRALNNLVTTETFTFEDSTESYTISKPDKLLYIIYEDCILDDNTRALVVPVKYDMLYETLNNPFKGPSKNRVIRVDSDPISLYSTEDIKKYNMTYIRRPKPIILEDLEDVTIEGKDSESSCELDKSIHQEILMRAVLLAKSTFTGS